ncbi:MAG TPA: response regulator transcription factor [Intrasporangium sp.]|nr:response regulator transcription factor [Intrasporangium sp.]
MRIVICDDHRLLIEAMGMAFSDLGHEVVALGTRPEDAVAEVRAHQPDVCLLDVNFPEGSSLDFIGRILAAGARTRVVVMSAWTERHTVARALLEGASGFVGKEQPITEIAEALERARQGHVAVDPALLREALRSDQDGDDPLWSLRFLTDREWEVMRCIMDGLTTAEMARELGVRHSTARTHVQNLLTKLGVHSRLKAAALMTAHASSESWPAHLRHRAATAPPPHDVAGTRATGGSVAAT